MAPPKKNPFMRYVEKRRKEEEVASGLTYSLKQAVELFAQEWANMDQAKRAPFMTKGKRDVVTDTSLEAEEVFKYGIEEVSTSTPYSDLKSIVSEDLGLWLKSKHLTGNTMNELYSKTLKEVHIHRWQRYQICRLLDEISGNPLTTCFVLVQFSLYVVADCHEYIPAEFAMASFSLEDGLIDNFCMLIDPGYPPLGYLNEFRKSCQKLGNPNPPFDSKCQNYKQIWESMVIFLKRYKTHNTDTTYLFCHPAELENTRGCLEWLSKKTGYPIEWDIFPYSILLHQMTRYAREKYIDWLKRQRMLDYEFPEQELKEFRRTVESQLTSSNEFSHDDEDDLNAESSSRISAWNLVDRNVEEDKINLKDLDMSNPPSVIKNGPMRARRIPKTDAHQLSEMLSNISSTDHPPGDSSDKSDLDSCASLPLSSTRTSTNEPLTNINRNYRDREIFVKEKQAEEFLDSLDLAFMPELACPHHMVNKYGVQLCPLNIVNRLIFNTIDILIGFFHIAPKEGAHYPHSDLMEERRKRRMQVQFYTHCTYDNLYGFKGSKFYKKIT